MGPLVLEPMRIEPVYLVAPRPKPPSMPTRRAFLLAGSTFVCGLGIGGACGYAAGTARSGDDPVADDEPLQPSGDALLDELRRLAIQAPIAELIAKRLDFLNHLHATYRTDAIAWRGVERLGDAVLRGEPIPNRRIFARWLAQLLENAEPAIAPFADRLIAPLRKVE